MSHYTTGPKHSGVRLRPMLPLLLLASMVAPLTTNILLPSLPGLAKSLDVSREAAQLAISAYIFAMAFTLLLIGPVSDRFGRRPTLLACFAVFTVASLMAIFATSIEMLVAARLLQALGATAGMSVPRTVVSDVSSRSETARIIAYMTAVMVLAPMAAPNVGSLLDSLFGWWSIFAFCAGLGALVFALAALTMKETRPQGATPPTAGEILDRSKSLLRNREFLRFAALTSTSTASYYALLGGAPDLIIDGMGRTPAEFGRWLIMLGIGYAAGNFLSGRIAGRVGLVRMAALGNMVLLLSGVLMVVGALAGLHVPLAVFLPALIMAFGNGLVLPSTMASALQIDPRAAGTASGLMGFIQMFSSAVMAQAIVSFGGKTALPIGLAIAISGLIAVVLLPPRFRQGPR
ncbi:MAG TPA: multidrug effflux MFS transporter [Beijerinckiaceae bacterium]|nr:multidrug effflux MFS transporter [Beijerinckiaceae bacterium]